MKFTKLLFLIFFPFSIFGQNTIGLPDVINYPKNIYNAGLQNWDIKQDKNGIIYVANNEGLLAFDGKNWNLYPLPNKTIVRSVEIAQDGKIYVGGQDELGYFLPSDNGLLQYHSLARSIPNKDKNFGDVWDIAVFNNYVFFRSNNKIFRIINESVATYDTPSQWLYMGTCNGHLYAHDQHNGIMDFKNDVWNPLYSNNTLPSNDPVTSILSLNKDTSIITTLKNGLFTLTSKGIANFPTVNNRLFKSERIYAATRINKDWIALATNNSGVYIIDTRGNIIQSFSKTEGIQNNNVLSIFLDNQSNLWLGLDNGIDLINYNSAIKQINPSIKDGPGYASIIYQNKLFIGTSNGLYWVDLQPMQDLSFSKGNFKEITNSQGQTWALADINNILLMGHHEGAFEIKDNDALPISKKPGYWNFVPLSNTFPSSKIIAGNYNGLQFFDFEKGKFIESTALPGFAESSRFVAIDNNQNIWVSHPYHGVFKIREKNDGTFLIHAYDGSNGLPSRLNNHIYKVKNEILIGTEQGVYAYDEKSDAFKPSPFYQSMLGDQSIRYLKADKEGNVWFIHEKSIGVIDESGSKPAIIMLPELNNKILSGFESIYPVNQNNIFLSGEKGIYHINFEKYKQRLSNLEVQIRTVRIINKTDSILFGGYYKNANEKQIQQDETSPEINSNWKTIRIEYSTLLFGYQSNFEYSYRLQGFDQGWSDWTKRTEKEYTNLPAGNYTFEVKVRKHAGNESPIAKYSFSVLPHWYNNTLAKILYFILFCLILFLFYQWQQKKFKAELAKYEEEQKRLKYIHELELSKSEGEVAALNNEKLEADLNFKNSELASSAMHLVKKGELISKIKKEITQIIKSIDNSRAIAELQKMLKTVGEDETIDKDWENFAKHFDKVHSDFIIALKEKHPTVSPNEIKLCAYLRMNLTTKEMAQLMNISVRGVEICRYRLRKKIQLPSEASLFNYLINIQTKDSNN